MFCFTYFLGWREAQIEKAHGCDLQTLKHYIMAVGLHAVPALRTVLGTWSALMAPNPSSGVKYHFFITDILVYVYISVLVFWGSWRIQRGTQDQESERTPFPGVEATECLSA